MMLIRRAGADAIRGGGLVLAAVTALASDTALAMPVPVLDLNQPADVVRFITGWLSRSAG